MFSTFDFDGDGFEFFVECDDDNAAIYPTAVEVPYNGIDEDCNPATLDDDLDQDGFILAEDCDDSNSAINSDAEDIPNNGIDEDCDGEDAISTSTDEVNQAMRIYPNPTSHLLHIEMEEEQSGMIYLKDLNGKLYSQQALKQNQGIDMTNYSAGVYLLIIQLKGQIVSERIIKL